MNMNTKAISLLLAVGALASAAAARDFEYQGIWYTVLDEDAKTCETVAREGVEGEKQHKIDGSVIIPATVFDAQHKQYTVTAIGNRSFEDRTIEKVEIANTVTQIGDGAFRYCNALNSVNLGNSVMSIGADAFYKCSRLESINLPESLTSIDESAFYDCNSLTSIEFPNSIINIGKYAFCYCDRLTSIQLPASLSSIKSNTFGACTNLTEVVIPNSVTSIEESAFYDCKNLKSINIPESVLVIGEGAFGVFNGIGVLTDIKLSANLQELGESVFSGQDNVRNVYYGAAEPIRGYFNTFSEKCYKDAVLHVSAEAVDKIKSTVPWSLFTNIEQSGIEEVEAEAAAADGEVYTLQGVRAAKPLKPGVYIGNGRKMIVK